MKIIITLALAMLGWVALPVAPLSAGQWNAEPAADALPAVDDVLPPDQILYTLHYMGFSPNTPAFLRGPYYVLHAYDPRGVEMRIVADAQLGDILSIQPALVLNQIYPPQYFSGPLIIHVPDEREHSEKERQRG